MKLRDCIFEMAASKNIDWDSEERLGQISDAELAKLLDVARESVTIARTKRGIPPFQRQGPQTKSEGEELLVISSKITKDELKLIDQLADQQGISRARLIREIIRIGIEALIEKNE